jgi:hypothetical protein
MKILVFLFFVNGLFFTSSCQTQSEKAHCDIIKFQILNSSLELAIHNANLSNDKKIKAIEVAVDKNLQNVVVLEDARRITKLSRNMIQEIQTYKDLIIKETGGFDENYSYEGSKDEEKTAQLMVGNASDGKKGKAYELKERLSIFVNELNKLAGTSFSPLAQDGKNDPLAKKNAVLKELDFAKLNFLNSTMIAGLAILTDKQFKITVYEDYALSLLLQKAVAGND